MAFSAEFADLPQKRIDTPTGHPNSGLAFGGPFCSGKSKYFFCSLMDSSPGTCPSKPAATRSSALVIQTGRPLSSLNFFIYGTSASTVSGICGE